MRILLLAILFFAFSPQKVFAFDHTHAAFQAVLDKHVKDGLVNYKAIKAAPEGLKTYLQSTAKVTKEEFQKWSETQQVAFLINLYNAETIELVIDHYPVVSIKDIGGFLGNPWKKEVVELFGEKTTLDVIEHEMLRKDYKRPEIHFAIVCASIGCPPLHEKVYLAEKLDKQLDERTRTFMADEDKNRVDNVRKRIVISPIFRWFSEDFEKKSGTTLRYVLLYMPKEKIKKVDRFWAIRYTEYDWSLNEQK